MKTLNRHIIASALKISTALVALFLVMIATGLVHNTELRLLNGIIMFGGCFMAIRKFKTGVLSNQFNYVSGLATGAAIVAISTSIFAFFVASYLFIDQELMQAIVENNAVGKYLNEFAIGMVIWIEGSASGILFSYITMQYLKPETRPSLTNK